VGVIRKGLESFSGSLTKSPGRFNVLTIRGAVVICDYGHNTSSLDAILEVLQQFSHSRRLALYTAAGDRRDIDIIEQGRMLGAAFDEVYLYEDQYHLRGREKGEISQLFQQILGAGQRVKKVESIQDWNNAVAAVLASARAGDLVLLQPNMIDEAVEAVGRILASDVSAREISFQEALALVQPVRQ
jgi:cyanophycin synthetase